MAGSEELNKVVHAVYKTPGKFLGFVNVEHTLNPMSISAPFIVESNP